MTFQCSPAQVVLVVGMCHLLGDEEVNLANGRSIGCGAIAEAEFYTQLLSDVFRLGGGGRSEYR